MGKDIIAVLYGEPDGLHQSETRRSPVTRIHIDVSAPEAFWAVVGVAVSFDSCATMCTGEIFNVALKSFGHCGSPEPVFLGYSLQVG